MTVGGLNNNLEDGVLVLEEDGSLMVYSAQEICIKNDIEVKVVTPARGKSIYSFFYSAHFAPPNGRDITCDEWRGMYNGSDRWKIINDFQSFSNVSEIELSCSLQNHIIAYNAQNEYRISYFLVSQYDVLKDFELKPPQYAMILPNEAGLYAIPHILSMNQGDPYKPKNPYERLYDLAINEKNKLLYLFVYYIILNVATNGGKVDMNVINQHKSWAHILSTSINDEEFDKKLNQALKDLFANDAIAHEVKSLLESIYDICCQNGRGTPYLNLENSGNQLLSLISKANSLYPFVTARFFDIVYSHNVNESTLLSSGELEMLNLYSRIYDATITNLSRKQYIPNLILLDEAEIGYHPEWQRKFVKNVITFLNSLGKGEDFFQVVLTSHSPIILSDIPRSCTNYLTRGKPIPTDETFGANIFDLYRNSFFMSDGLIGEYAWEKILQAEKSIKHAISNPNDTKSKDIMPLEEAKKIVKEIGDDRIKDYFFDLLFELEPREKLLYCIKKYEKLINTNRNEQD